jgi:solute carrier family 15 oligopeptide transporter 1
MAINSGSVLSAVTPVLKDGLACFGDELVGETEKQTMCYFAGFILPCVLFACAFALFVYGDRYYRVVPPVGEFVPGKMVLVIKDATVGYFQASSQERQGRSFMSFGEKRFGAVLAEETGEFLRMLTMILPMSFVWMVYDQQSTEWQDQYDMMDQYWGNVHISPEIWTTLVNPVLVVALLYIMATYLYPMLENRGIVVSPLRRMALGSLLVTTSFALSGGLHYKVQELFVGELDIKSGLVLAKTCKGKCLHGSAQLPQWFLLTLGECLFSPTVCYFCEVPKESNWLAHVFHFNYDRTNIT